MKEEKGGKRKKKRQRKKITDSCRVRAHLWHVRGQREEAVWRFGGGGLFSKADIRGGCTHIHTQRERERERERGPGRESWIKAAAGGGGRDEERRRRNKRVVCWQSFFLQKSPAALHCAGRSWCFAGIFVSDAESAVISGGFLPPPLPTPPHLSFPSRWTVPSSRAVARICFIRRRSSSSSSSYSNARYKCAKIART